MWGGAKRRLTLFGLYILTRLAKAIKSKNRWRKAPPIFRHINLFFFRITKFEFDMIEMVDFDSGLNY
jgi:hypothetical protein